ncbi:MAG: MFS transporter [Rhodospirillaceae bacterium]
MTQGAPAPVWIAFGTSEYRRTGLAFFLAGFATFSLLYCVQPLLPLFAEEFAVSPAQSSLTLSLATGALAFSVTAAGAFSQGIGRRGLMFASITSAALLQLLASVAPDWHMLLAARALEGFVLGGLPAVAMAYLAEEIEPAHLGKSMGLYVAGTAFGGMMGRIGMGVLTEWVSWRPALALFAACCCAAALGFRLLLPPSRNFVRRPGLGPRFHFKTFRHHLANRGLLRIYASAFLSMSVFVTLYNYMTFRLTEAPYLLSQTVISMVFLIYGFGVVSSSMGGMLSDKFGGRPLLIFSYGFMLIGVLITLAANLTLIIIGLTVMTIAFFIVHAVGSGSIGPLSDGAKAHASALYLLFYYLGSSVSGTAGGWFWEHGGWAAVAAFAGTSCVLGLALALSTRARPRGPAAPIDA